MLTCIIPLVVSVNCIIYYLLKFQPARNYKNIFIFVFHFLTQHSRKTGNKYEELRRNFYKRGWAEVLKWKYTQVSVSVQNSHTPKTL